MIVVTGSRIADYEMDEPPHVRLERRADAMAMTVTLECDTRDLSERERELRATLRNLLRAADRDARFDLGMIVEINTMGDEMLMPFTAEMIETASLARGRRADTSQATISLVSEIGQEDSRAALISRFEGFLDGVDLVGRAEFLPGRDVNLTVTGGPARYRGDLISAIAEDAAQMAARFGERYDVQVAGLENAVRWQRAGPLSLTVYIDYDLTVQPR
ncbi:MAG: hypothetical protein RIA71_10715 [Oceanicaulis sp.]